MPRTVSKSPNWQTLDGFTIVLTNRFPAISGTLRDAKGTAVPEGTAILFPDESSLWIEDLRTVRTTRVDRLDLTVKRPVSNGDGYSYLRARLGSIRAARLAGITPAAIATENSTTTSWPRPNFRANWSLMMATFGA
jgi:hypothetical protein